MPPSFHELRHTFAAFGIAHGLTLSELQQSLGHKRATTTEVYLGIARNKELTDKVVNKIGDARIA